MSKIFSETITIAEQAELFSKVDNFFNLNEKNCHIWRGEIYPDGYPLLRFTFRGVRTRIRVHRLIYYLLNGALPLVPQIHVSHLCNTKLCINIEHLNYEEAVVNIQRNSCFGANKCFGHVGHPNCII